MQGHITVGLRIACMSGALFGISRLFSSTLGREQVPTVFDTVYSHCIIILVSLCYYSVVKFVLSACYPPKHRPRRISLVPRDVDGNYVDMQITTATEIIRGAPKLTIQNVWILVYGVGYILFAVGYCILGLHPLCQACFGLGMGVLAVDELICPRHPMSKLYASARAAALSAALVSLILVSSELLDVELIAFASSLDLYSLAFGICLPIAAQFLMIAVRDNQRYSLGSVVEVCEFGLPFTVFLGVFHLSVAYGQRFQLSKQGSTLGYDSFLNQTWYPGAFSAHIRTDGPFLAFYSISPLLLCPSLLAYVSCVLQGCTVDTLLSVCLALCVHYLLERPASLLGIYGAACCGLAILVRVISEYTPDLRDWRLQADSGQLTQQVVWERDARRAREAEELTRDLEPVNA